MHHKVTIKRQICFANYFPNSVLCEPFFCEQDVGSGMDPSIATVLVGLMRLIMSLFTTVLLRRFGRRPLCMLSACGMAVCMVASGWATWYIYNGK